MQILHQLQVKYPTDASITSATSVAKKAADDASSAADTAKQAATTGATFQPDGAAAVDKSAADRASVAADLASSLAIGQTGMPREVNDAAKSAGQASSSADIAGSRNKVP